MTFEELLNSISQDIGINFLNYENSRGFTFVYHNQWDISVEYCENHNKVHIYACVNKLMNTASEALLERMLQTHLFGIKTHQAYFGVSDKTNEILLFRTLSLQNLTYDEFALAMEYFVDVLETWEGIVDSPIMKVGT